MKILITSALILLATLPFLKTTSASEITKAEKEGLQLMRVEEKLAHDVYMFLYEKWELPIFNNIANAETRHFNAVGSLMVCFDLNDSAMEEPGKFKQAEFLEMYENLTTQGSISVVEALKVGAYIEELDIQDLQELLAENENEQIGIVYGNLLRASGNHIRAFTSQLGFRNVVYTPTILDKDIYTNIINAKHQRGNRMNRK